MKDHAPEGFQYPSTRYSGSKRRLVDWIWEQVRYLPFDSVLDAFGGTGSVSLLFKRYGKQVFYNDLLRFNQIVAKAIIENDTVNVTSEDVDRVLKFSLNGYPTFIQEEYAGVFFIDEENAWLDKVITNILRMTNEYKKAIFLASLFQACLSKRPFNLFHRANLNIRQASVSRTFGNKTTWEHPFPELFKRYVTEYNNAVFSNGRKNKVVGGHDALLAPNGVDLVYLDPPYFSARASQGTNYLAFYHFLEGLADYENWPARISSKNSGFKRIPDSDEISRFTEKTEVLTSFNRLLNHFRDNIIVLSYQSNGIPTKDEIERMLRDLGKDVRVYSRPHRYVLSSHPNNELLFIAT
jgi:adenine-specific DNA-methyltransferase